MKMSEQTNNLPLKKADIPTDVFPWGRLEWFARRTLNGLDITLGFCHLSHGRENSHHIHPNCDEVLFVVKGSIIHRIGEDEIPMGEGDSLLIPKGVPHSAKNIGDFDAVLSISFTNGDRQTVNVDA